MAAEIVELTREEFDALGEYSCSIPTAPRPGFRWKRNRDEYTDKAVVSRTEEKVTGVLNNWWMGEAFELDPPEPEYVGIKWRKIQLKKER